MYPEVILKWLYLSDSPMLLSVHHTKEVSDSLQVPLQSVSYTHLDVYKRQQYDRTDRQNNDTSDQADNKCYCKHSFSVLSCCINAVFPKLLADNDRGKMCIRDSLLIL